jgi:SAM-dependent methyltransferase
MKNVPSGEFTCRICGNADSNKEHTAVEMMYGMRDEFLYTECGKCGCLQINEIPSNVSSYYPSDYYSYKSELKLKERLKLLARSLLISARINSKQPFRKILDSYKTYSFLDFACENNYLNPSSKILDVGCGSGRLLLQLRYLGFKYVDGIDPFIDEDIDYKNGVSVKRRYLNEVRSSYDLVMLNHSFEHMENPESSMREIHQILLPGGYTLIRIPVASSFAWKHYGVNWVQLDAPRHLYLHTVESLKILAARVGLEFVRVHFDSNELQFWGSEQYAAGISLSDRKSSSLSGKKLKEYRDKALELNAQQQGDQACFVLRRGH